MVLSHIKPILMFGQIANVKIVTGAHFTIYHLKRKTRFRTNKRTFNNLRLLVTDDYHLLKAKSDPHRDKEIY